MTTRIVQLDGEAVLSELSFNDLCHAIKRGVESEMDGLWHCTVLYADIGSHSFTYDDQFIVIIQYGGKLKLTVHKVYDDINIKKIANLLNSGKLGAELVVERRDMCDQYVAIVKQVVLQGIKSSTSLTQLVKLISKQLSKRVSDNSNTWHVFAFRTYLANCYCMPKTV
ncbi:uncharacterized protein LOC128957104 [Oppia nitens]|uniref:uncharacterized protein LOC128957104 n=1 Tax=Oppia nitens TaxID=1686743 RepID=UPI0023DA87B5|nr:uncharacterized protein LOC128957104 [Oppia nitens]